MPSLFISTVMTFNRLLILKNATLSTRCYPIMGQNMGQDGLSGICKNLVLTF